MATKKENVGDRKVLSHAERFWNALELEKCNAPYPTEVTEYSNEVSLQDGVKVTKRTVKTKKLSDCNKGLRWYDFSLDSLQYSGAIANLKYQTLADTAFDAVEKMESYADGVLDSLDNNSLENNDK